MKIYFAQLSNSIKFFALVAILSTMFVSCNKKEQELEVFNVRYEVAANYENAALIEFTNSTGAISAGNLYKFDWLKKEEEDKWYYQFDAEKGTFIYLTGQGTESSQSPVYIDLFVNDSLLKSAQSYSAAKAEIGYEL